MNKFDFNDAGSELEDLTSNNKDKVEVELDQIQDDEEYNDFVFFIY